MMSHPWKRSLLALCLFSVILLGCILYWRWFREGESIVDAFQKETYSIKTGAFFSDGDVPVLSELDREVSKISSFASQSLVTISATGSSDVGYRSNNEDGRIGSHIVSRAQGSGVIVSKEGHIITNYHVIRGKSYIQAILGDGEVTTARVIGVDQLLDIAVLKIDLQKDLQPIPFGNSDEVKTGQIVMALGTPYGWAKTVTQGIVSGRDRKFNSVGINYIQTDATIHQGNSGGPLINIYGEMIGINSSILSGRISSGGTLGFAIPSNIVLQAFKQICEYGRPMRGYLGIDFVESSQGLKNFIHYQDKDGAIINSIRYNSPAEKAGLQIGDVILECNGNKIEEAKELLRELESLQGGDTIRFVVWRQGRKLSAKITLDDTTKELELNNDSILVRNGITARDLSLVERTSGVKGIVIEEVKAMSNEHKNLESELKAGDFIFSVDGQEINSVKELDNKLKKAPVVIFFVRNNRMFRLKLQLDNTVQGTSSKNTGKSYF